MANLIQSPVVVHHALFILLLNHPISIRFRRLIMINPLPRILDTHKYPPYGPPKMNRTSTKQGIPLGG